MRYRSRIPNPALIAPIMLTVEPGQEFDSEIGLNHPELEPLDDEAKAFAENVRRQNEAHAAAYRAQVGPGVVEGPVEAVLPSSVPPALPDYRAALGLEPLPPTPGEEPPGEESPAGSEKVAKPKSRGSKE